MQREGLMSGLPLLYHGARRCADPKESSTTDLLTGEDPLPAKLEMKKEGLVFARDTRLTKVAGETTDDN